MSSVILHRGKEQRLLAGHCWVYAGEIAQITGDPADGSAVEIRDHKQRFLGRGLINRQSRITVRRFTTAKEELDEAFFRRRLAAALAYREGLGEVCRLVWSESDALPGLVVDRYGDHLVIQALTLGIDQRKGMILDLLREFVQPFAVVERSDVSSRRLEGLAETKGVLVGQTNGRVAVDLDGVRYEVHLLEDQKTGVFLDQRDNYRTVAALSAGRRVLDCFSYHGGFAIAAARAGASSVEAVEISEAATTRARRNAELNELGGRVSFVVANAFDLLKQYDAEKRQYDLVVLDPPSFTRSRQTVPGALRGYKEINLRALKMLGPGGRLATFSCSHHIDAATFREVIVAAAADARRTVRLRQVLTQSRDHPILPAVPETEYLRGLLLEVV